MVLLYFEIQSTFDSSKGSPATAYAYNESKKDNRAHPSFTDSIGGGPFVIGDESDRGWRARSVATFYGYDRYSLVFYRAETR